MADGRVAVSALVLGLAGPLLVGAAQADAPPLPRDRQVVLERQIGHLRNAGEVSCIRPQLIRSEYIISDTRILYRATGGTVFDAALGPGCRGLARSPYAPRIVSRGSEVCTGDMIELGGPARTERCAITGFTRWERPAS